VKQWVNTTSTELSLKISTESSVRSSLSTLSWDPEIFDALDDLGRTIDNIPKPGIRERTAISRAFKQGMPVSEFDEDCDQIPNFDHLADLVEEHSHA